MNPNFKPEMITPKLLKACGDQVQKYFGQRKFDPVDDDCLICRGVEPYNNCDVCPLASGYDEDTRFLSCLKAPTYLAQHKRGERSKEQLLARGKFLIKTLDEHGITIYDKEGK